MYFIFEKYKITKSKTILILNDDSKYECLLKYLPFDKSCNIYISNKYKYIGKFDNIDFFDLKASKSAKYNKKIASLFVPSYFLTKDKSLSNNFLVDDYFDKLINANYLASVYLRKEFHSLTEEEYNLFLDMFKYWEISESKLNKMSYHTKNNYLFEMSVLKGLKQPDFFKQISIASIIC